MQQLTNRVIMISPDQFGFNPQTASSNDWQNVPENENEAQSKALKEFKTMVATLQKEGIEVTVLPSRKDTVTPDAIFPNNWFSTHATEKGCKIIIYPMLTANRRAERQVDNLLKTLTKQGLPTEIIDISADENENKILEGTGSLVLDRQNNIAYALESPRTVKEKFKKWCKLMNFSGVFFHGINNNTTNPVYHTNVAMSVGKGFAVICTEAIPTEQERKKIINKLQQNGEVIEISLAQMSKFAGNILHLKSITGELKIVMSKQAFHAFTNTQKNQLKKYGKLVPVDITTIEKVGGGSARCMLAEIFPAKSS
ncbi:MAG TPA: arginine deiminase-related protein [Patescibacteria group bacterium]